MEEIILQTLIKMRTDYGNKEMIIFAQDSDLKVVAEEIKTAIDVKQQSERLCDKNEYGKINKLYIRVGDEWIPYNEQTK